MFQGLSAKLLIRCIIAGTSWAWPKPVSWHASSQNRHKQELDMCQMAFISLSWPSLYAFLRLTVLAAPKETVVLAATLMACIDWWKILTFLRGCKVSHMDVRLIASKKKTKNMQYTKILSILRTIMHVTLCHEMFCLLWMCNTYFCSWKWQLCGKLL